jgi:Skp family chaperone for outer membrane proteins
VLFLLLISCSALCICCFCALPPVQNEVVQLRDAADSQQAEVERAAAGAAEAKVQQLQEQLEQAQAALQAKEAELASAQSMLDSAGRKEHDELLRLQVCERKGESSPGIIICAQLLGHDN